MPEIVGVLNVMLNHVLQYWWPKQLLCFADLKVLFYCPRHSLGTPAALRSLNRYNILGKSLNSFDPDLSIILAFKIWDPFPSIVESFSNVSSYYASITGTGFKKEMSVYFIHFSSRKAVVKWVISTLYFPIALFDLNLGSSKLNRKMPVESQVMRKAHDRYVTMNVSRRN